MSGYPDIEKRSKLAYDSEAMFSKLAVGSEIALRFSVYHFRRYCKTLLQVIGS